MTGCLKNLRIGALWWTTRAEVRNEADWMRALSDPDACLAAAVHRFKDSSNVTIVRLPAASQTGPNLVLRRLNYGRLRHRLRDTFRRSRAQRALRMALRMEAAGLPVARGLAAADVRRWRWPLRAYFVTEEIRAARTLAEIANGPAQPPRECVERLAQLLAQLHERGFSHRDLKATNVLFDPEGQPFLIDLDGVKQFRHLPRKRAAKDLARLVAGLRSSPWLQPRLIIRFLKVYCRAQTESDWRAWFSMVEAALQRYQE
jgi:tRNA A-37 threonylcarbamoyl transferase component Bud32